MLKVGDKVIPLSKSCYGSLDYSAVWRRAKAKGQPFLYITELNPSQSIDYLLSEDKDADPFTVGGDYFMEKDLILFCVNKGEK